MNPNVPNQSLQSLFFLLFLFIFFYLFIIRPEQKRQREHKRLIENIKKNDEVVTTSGIHGTVVDVREKTFILRVDDKVRIEIDKSAIAYLKKSSDKS